MQGETKVLLGIVAACLVIYLGVILSPTVRTMIGAVPTAGFNGMTKLAKIGLPYLFFAFIAWAVYKATHGGGR